MSTRDTLNELVQRVGLNKAVKLLNAKGVGKATYQKMANGDIPVSKSVVGKASYANRLAGQQIDFRQNKQLAKRLGFEKVQQRIGEKTPSLKSSLKDLQTYNRRFTDRKLSLPSVHRLTGINQVKLKRAAQKYFVDISTLHYEQRQIVAKNAQGENMYLVALKIPNTANPKSPKIQWYFATNEYIENYERWRAGDKSIIGSDPWEIPGAELLVAIA